MLACRKSLLVLLTLTGLLAAGVSSASGVPAGSTALTASTVEALSSPEPVVMAAKPVAQLSAFQQVLASGKIRVQVRSNAKWVKLTWRTAKNKKRAATIKIHKGKGARTLSKGSHAIYAQAKATRKLRRSPKIPVLPPVDTTAPGPVTALVVTAITPTSVTLAWRNPTDADLATVIVRRDGTAVHTESGTTYTDPGLSINTPYHYEVLARDKAGNTSAPAVVTARTGVAMARVSVASDGGQAAGSSDNAAVSGDGRYVAFASLAANLVTGDTNGVRDVFVRDRGTGLTTRVSVGTAGSQANGNSYGPSISADGRYVAFCSSASNLVTDDTNNAVDVFVYDVATATTTRVSLATDRSQANGNSDDAVISADGRYVAFMSFAANLVTGDTNATPDVFVHDRGRFDRDATTTRASVAGDGSQANGNSASPAISAEGRYVAFASTASNLVTGDTNNETDVFVHDGATGATARVSVASDGSQGNWDSDQPAISADGRYVAFGSTSTNLVTGDTNAKGDIFVNDRGAAATTRVSVATDGSQSTGFSYRPAISADGRYVAFAADSANLVAGDTNARWDVFVHDRGASATTRVSVAADASQATQSSDDPTISADGRYVAFTSEAPNLVAGDTNNAADAFIAQIR